MTKRSIDDKTSFRRARVKEKPPQIPKEKLEALSEKEIEAEFGVKIPIEPTIYFDEATDTFRCKDPSLARLIGLVTNGDKQKARLIVESYSTRNAILRDAGGWIRLKLLAKYLDSALEANLKDPGQRILEMIVEFSPRWTKRQPVGKRKPDKSPDAKSVAEARNILELVKAGEKVRKRKNP